MLCEHCGYNLTGLALEGRCPECGHGIPESVCPQSRRPTPWEEHPSLGTWLTTRHAVLFDRAFGRHMQARQGAGRSRWFGLLEFSLASVWFSLAILRHAGWLGQRTPSLITDFLLARPVWTVCCLPVVVLALLLLLYRLTARLTAWEAAYRGLRLPRVTAERGLHYHTVHVHTVALLTLVLMVVLAKLPFGGSRGDLIYLYTLCGFVIIAAGYLFLSYWAIMRKLLYANF